MNNSIGINIYSSTQTFLETIFKDGRKVVILEGSGLIWKGLTVFYF